MFKQNVGTSERETSKPIVLVQIEKSQPQKSQEKITREISSTTVATKKYKF